MATRTDIEHLLRRTEFAARSTRVDALMALSYAGAVDNVLAVPAAAVAAPPSLATHQRIGNFEQYRTAVHWWFDRMATQSPRPLQEKMALFWHGHFCTSWNSVGDTPRVIEQNQLWRHHGLGNLSYLAKTMARQPAMLRYLDNAKNFASSPNQNFARELLELFLIGAGNYTEADVEAATRAWTGHGLDPATGGYRFDATKHDSGTKTFLDKTGAWGGSKIIDIVLGPGAVIAVGDNAGLPSRVVAARFLSRKLWEAFAYEDPEDAVTFALADVLIASGFEIKPWVRAMLLRPEFRSDRARRGLVRSPAEYVAAVLYHADVAAPVAHPEWYCADMGQALFEPPDVNGWGVNEYWLNGSAATGRAAFADSVRRRLTAGRPDGRLQLRGGSWTWAELDAMTPSRLVTSLASGFELTLTDTTRSSIGEWAKSEFNWSKPDWWRTANALFLLMLSAEMNVA